MVDDADRVSTDKFTNPVRRFARRNVASKFRLSASSSTEVLLPGIRSASVRIDNSCRLSANTIVTYGRLHVLREILSTSLSRSTVNNQNRIDRTQTSHPKPSATLKCSGMASKEKIVSYLNTNKVHTPISKYAKNPLLVLTYDIRSLGQVIQKPQNIVEEC